jgi:hypothetical protein
MTAVRIGIKEDIRVIEMEDMGPLSVPDRLHLPLSSLLYGNDSLKVVAEIAFA